MEYLYHGSVVQNIKILEPRKRHTPSATIDFSAIYATPLPAYAVTHSFPWTSDEGFDVNVTNGKVEMIVPKEYRERLQVPISIYKVFATDFVHTKDEESGYTWHATCSVPVLEEAKYGSVEDALNKLGCALKFR